MKHEEYIKMIIERVDKQGRLKARERNDLEFKESFGFNSWIKYAKTMAAFANNHGGYILFGIKDNPREIVGVNSAFSSLKQEKLTESLNSLFSPEILWDVDTIEGNGFNIGYIYTYEAVEKPVIALKNEASEKINCGDVFYRYRARSEKIKYPEMIRIIEDRVKQERERILKLMETIRNSDTTNIGIVNYSNGRFTTPYGADVIVDKRIVLQVLRKAKYIKSGSFDDNGGTPVLKVTGNIDLCEEVPVPDIDPNIKYPYLQKQLAEKLGVEPTLVYALVWYYKMKNNKKYHMEVSTSSTGASKVHKFSDIALQFLIEELKKHGDESNWQTGIKNQYYQRKKG